MERVGKRSLIVGCLALLASALLAWFLLSPDPIPAYLVPTAQELEIMEDSIEAYSAFEMVRADELVDIETIEALFADAELLDPIADSQHPPAISDAEIRTAQLRLKALMAQFVRFRILPDERYTPQQNLDRYIAWRHGRGDELFDIDAPDLYIAEVYEQYTGEPVPPGSTKESVFRDVYAKMEQKRSASNIPVAIAATPDAQLFVSWWYHTHIGPHQPEFTHPMGGEGWVENFTAGAMSWFRHAQSDPGMTTKMRVYLRAYSGVVVEFADGSKYPLVLSLRWESRDMHWVIEHIIYANTNRQKIEALIF